MQKLHIEKGKSKKVPFEVPCLHPTLSLNPNQKL